MRAHFSNSVYLGAALAVLGVVVTGLWLFAPDASRPGEWKAAAVQKTQSEPVDGSAFRYGPEINHARGDVAVHAREQALKEAKGMAPDEQRRASGWSQRSSTVTFTNRGLQSGH